MKKAVVTFLKENPSVVKNLERWLVLDEVGKRDECPQTMRNSMDSFVCIGFCTKVFPKIGTIPGDEVTVNRRKWKGCPCLSWLYTEEDVIETVEQYLEKV